MVVGSRSRRSPTCSPARSCGGDRASTSINEGSVSTFSLASAFSDQRVVDSVSICVSFGARRSLAASSNRRRAPLTSAYLLAPGSPFFWRGARRADRTPSMMFCSASERSGPRRAADNGGGSRRGQRRPLNGAGTTAAAAPAAATSGRRATVAGWRRGGWAASPHSQITSSRRGVLNRTEIRARRSWCCRSPRRHLPSRPMRASCDVVEASAAIQPSLAGEELGVSSPPHPSRRLRGRPPCRTRRPWHGDHM